MKAKSITKLVLLLVVITALLLLSVFGLNLGVFKIPSASEGIKYGLDIAGGASILYEAQSDSITAEQASAVVETLRARLDGKGFTEANVSREGDKRFLVEIPEVKDPEEIIKILGTTAKLTFVDPAGTEIITGADVEDATAQINDTQTGRQIVVALEFEDSGRQAFTDATKRLYGQPEGQNFIAIMMDDQIISAPRVNAVIDDSSCVIEGDFTTEEAQELASLIRSGNLPFELKEISSNTVSATMGVSALNESILAGLISLLLIIVYMIIFYRLPGLMSAISLVFYAVLVVLLLALFGVNLTLSGIAGIVLSMGMAVDANVVIFERIIDELKAGKTVRASVEAGFHRAMTAVIDPNVTTLISSAVLWLMGSGTVKGFAITLFLGVLVSMFTAIFVTKFLMTRMIELNVKNRKLYGIGVN